MEMITLIIKILIYWVICYVLSSTVHELGHVIYGLLNHWKLFMLIIGPLKLFRETLDSKIKLGIEKNIVLWGGVGGTLPTLKSEDNIKIWSNILLAGPLTSIIFGLLIFPLFLLSDSLFLLMLSLMSIAMGSMCVIPMKLKTGLLYNDGTRYKRIKGGGQEEAEEKALFLLMEITLFDDEKSLYPQELIDPLLKSKDYELNYYGYYYSYQNAVKTNDLEQANAQRAKMEEIKSKVPKIIIDDCRLET